MHDHSKMQEAGTHERADPAIEAQQQDILILTASTGAGHDTVAIALQQAIHVLAPEIRVRVVDALSAERDGGLLSPERWYDAMVEYAPRLWGLIYRATDAEWAVTRGMAAGELLWAERLRNTLRTARPGIIVSVHPLCTRLAAAVLRTMPNAPPLHCVVTDLVTVHRCWASDAVRRYYVATSDASEALIALGIPHERIQVTGLPLRASFVAPPHAQPKDTVARVLLLGGGRASRRTENAARALAGSDSPLHLVVVCGHNTRLQQRLNHDLGARAAVFGWRDDIAALMRWSSVVVTKGGPTTVVEAMSQSRPVVIYEALEDQETGNVAFAERSGSGCYVQDVDALAHAVGARSRTFPADDSAQALWLGSAAQRVAAGILTVLREPSVALPDAVDPPGGEDDSDPLGRVICNPVSGERIIIRQSGDQTGGRLLSFDLFLPPGGHVPARHVHPSQEERFTVVEGQMRFRLGWRRSIVAVPGDTIVVPPGRAHWFGNAGEEVSHARVEVRPALRLQEVFERSAALEVVERFPGTRMPRLSDLALLMVEFRRELAVPDVPAFLVTAFFAPLAWLGRRRHRRTSRRSAR
jgi:UDP-N-acetylglucosamine:LPS N-acetylglucosamine transferase/quercetin dioxygenase-like cupin family protein